MTVRPVDFDNGDALAVEGTGEPSPIAAGSFDADELDDPEIRQPTHKAPIASRRGRERFDAKERSSFI